MPPASKMSRSRGEYSASSVTSVPSCMRAGISSSPFSSAPEPRQLPLLTLLEPVVVGFVFETKRQYALGDQVPAVDAGEALGDHGADAEVQRREGGVLAAGALPVVVPADDEARPHLFSLLVYSGSKRRKVNLAISGTFDRNDMTSTPSGARSPVEMSSSTTMVTVASSESGSSGASGGGLMFGPRGISMPEASSSGAGSRICRSSTAGFAGASGSSGTPELARVGDDAAQSRRRRRRRAREVDLVRRCPRTSREVPVESPHAHGLRGRRLAHPDARTARRLEHPRPGPHEVGVHAGLGDGVQDLAAPGVTVMTSPGYTVSSRKTAAATARSWKPELTELPMQTCAAFVPATSLTGTTFPGECGLAMSGSSLSSSMCSCSS